MCKTKKRIRRLVALGLCLMMLVSTGLMASAESYKYVFLFELDAYYDEASKFQTTYSQPFMFKSPEFVITNKELRSNKNIMRIYNETTEPTAIINGFHVRPGMFDVYGATAVSRGVNFTVHTHYGTSCELLLFHQGDETPYATIPFPKAYKIGDVYSMLVFGLNIEEFEYAYRVDGPYDPREGHLFDRDAILLDPYAKAVAGQSDWGVSYNESGYHARVVRNNFDWGTERQPLIPMEDLIIYELHVRGFTQHPSSGVEHRGTFAGLKEKIPYLKELGIIEKIIWEPQPANVENVAEIAQAMQQGIRGFLQQYLPLDGEALARQRYERFRKM